MLSRRRGHLRRHRKLTLGEFLTHEWLPAKRSTVKATTWESYERHVLKYVVPSIGNIALQNVTASRLNAFYSDMLDAGRRTRAGGLAVKTVKNIHGTLHKALEDAVRWGSLAKNPADQADPPKGSSPEMRVWTPEQLHAFLKAVEAERLYAAWRLAALTGVRRGELVGLRWTDVDVEASRLTVRQIRTMVGSEVVTTTPKTRQAVRTLALDRGRHRRSAPIGRCRPRRGSLWVPGTRRPRASVFTNPDGSPVHPVRIMRWFEQLRERAELPPIRFHDVRHSYATALLRAGVPLKVVSQRLGHSSPVVTMTIYQHVLPGDDDLAAEVGAKAIFG